MNRVIAFVDGFNLYHSLADNPDYHKYKWLDIRKLIEIFGRFQSFVRILPIAALSVYERNWNDKGE
jgi:hypothetical protein